MEKVQRNHLTSRLSLATRMRRVETRKEALMKRVKVFNERERDSKAFWIALGGKKEEDWVPVFLFNSLPLNAENVMANEHEIGVIEQFFELHREQCKDGERVEEVVTRLRKEGEPEQPFTMEELVEQCQLSEEGKANLTKHLMEAAAERGQGKATDGSKRA
ncbi:hypothetical protein BJ508DRAFT_313566 [Ascobolus immersus RN42]|uniref:Uncharacterized protein n=1 Tax=Ascobolus immersus RN42 TaxID=1160509 RepID=A0A3N4HK95_ASCIM|nr:hypothetical protein BJ508DRAFT_313566 [Ascobolus immersus RN42]